MLRGKGKQVTFLGDLFVPLLRAAFFLYLPAASLSPLARPIAAMCVASLEKHVTRTLAPWKIHISHFLVM
jgi:hypothetical protein